MKYYILYNLIMQSIAFLSLIVIVLKFLIPTIKEARYKKMYSMLYGMVIGLVVFLADFLWSIYLLITSK